MSALTSSLRKQMETSVLAARRAAEGASRASIEGLGVFADRRPEHLDADQAALRNGLRAKWRQLGGDRELLVAECAYEQWHRLLFARFLAENGLLLHPRYQAPVTLTDCEELAPELGEPDAWSVAARFAAEILPGIFRLDDPCVRLRLAPEGRRALEQILDALPTETFAAEDALGWVYQFWQKDKKDEVNASERKIGGADLGPVTQLFTENYMVRFLLENSVGAWWAARHPDSQLIKGFDYLRFDDDRHPAAGSFDSWPEHVAEVTVMDPCCGSGHFLVEAFSMLWQMRAEEEGLGPVDAQDAVLRDNLFGLELDPRCVQIAMFNVALQAWKAGGGWRRLPVPNIACSGIPVKASVEEWTALAGGDARLAKALVRLHILFRDADTLGSLIDPRAAAETTDRAGPQRSIEDVDWTEVLPLFEQAAARGGDDPAATVLGNDAVSAATAAELLSSTYTLVTTNPPFLGANRHGDALLRFADVGGRATLDLAYLMKLRARAMAHPGASSGLVLPSEWLVSPRFAELRRSWLANLRFSVMARLGYGSFVSGLRVNPLLEVFTRAEPLVADYFDFIDVPPEAKTPQTTAAALQTSSLRRLTVGDQLRRPDSVISPSELTGQALGDVAECRWGLGAGDGQRFERLFWEVPALGEAWELLQSSATTDDPFGGRYSIVLWENEMGAMAKLAHSVRHLNNKAQQWRSGKPFWGRSGVALNRVGQLRATLYTGDRFSEDCLVIVPMNAVDVPAIWSFARSGDLEVEIRSIDRTLAITPRSVRNATFDIDRWRKVAEEAGPLPEPWSDDPTQWLFEGRPEGSTSPLQVAVARLVGYRWPEQAESDDLDAFADRDGIVCLPSVAGEAPASDRVQQVLAAAFGEVWSPTKVKDLLEQVGSRKKNLTDWLRDEFFKQHCALFGNRPFVWHIWDGQRDGFSALVNYHRLDRKTLEKLTYTYLGQDWVERQRAEVRDEIPGAEARLSTALGLQGKLEAILEGEKPFDIYLRWKQMHEQPIGWEPDLNDGVRLNVRPFVEADVLRSPFNIHWRKDRGKNPDGSERENDRHLSLGEKEEARKRAGRL
jgi:hypothetical protein